MLPGQAPTFVVYKYVGLDPMGNPSFTPVAGSPTMEGAKEAAEKMLKLEKYMIAVSVGVFLSFALQPAPPMLAKSPLTS